MENMKNNNQGNYNNNRPQNNNIPVNNTPKFGWKKAGIAAGVLVGTAALVLGVIKIRKNRKAKKAAAEQQPQAEKKA